MIINSPHEYMDQAEAMLREYAAKNARLTVWRMPWSDPDFSHKPQVDTILVCIPANNATTAPSGLVVVYTHVYSDLQDVAIIKTMFKPLGYLTKHVPFSRNWFPLDELRKAATRLPSLS